jgi:hypothetical protein
MQAALRVLVCLVISGSIALANVPAQIGLPLIEKTACCAKMKAEAVSHDCERHMPKPAQDKQCCSLCSLCCALPATVAAPFVYPPVGDEKFAAFISSERLRSERPPVPPPRA